MTLEELETKLDEVIETSDSDVRATKIVDLKLAMRDYKAERDEVELQKDAEIEALRNDITSRDTTIAELRDSNSALALRYGEMARFNEKKETEEKENEVKLDDLIKRFD